MIIETIDQSGQTVMNDDVVYEFNDSSDRLCFLCGSYGYGIIGDWGEGGWVCEQHWDEYLRDETDWWELIRLVSEDNG